MRMADVILGLARVATGTTPHWLTAPPDLRHQPCIFFANHTSHLDLLVLLASLPASIREHVRPVAARDYWDASRVRQYLARHVFKALLIERRKVTRHNNPLAPMLEALDAGTSLILFPEGTRNPDATIQPFHSGLFHLLTKRPHVQALPVYIDNANRVLPKGELLPLPLIVHLSFGAAMRTQPGETKQAFLDRARQAIEQLRDEI